jgi:hypothetical protein
MPTLAKTTAQIFIETAAGFWRAIGELANVGNRYGVAHSLQREAAKVEATLQKTLDSAVEDWNEEATEAELRISLCESQVRFAPWISECETYTPDHDNGRYCLPCAEAKASYEQSEVE